MFNQSQFDSRAHRLWRGGTDSMGPQYRSPIDDVYGNPYYHSPTKTMTRLIETCFRRVLGVVVISLLLTTSGLAQSNERMNLMPDNASSTQCTTKTGLYCETYGSGDPILALHGLGASVYTWRKLVEPLAKNNELVLIDLKGAGKSPKPHDNRYSIQEQADLILQFILEHDLKNLTLMGNSYGGAVSLLVALKLIEEKSNRLSKLILIDSGGYNEDLPWHLKLMRTPILGWLAIHIMSAKSSARTVLRYSYYNKSLITRDQIAAYAGPIASPGGKYALLKTAQQAIPKNINEITALYPTITVPTLILWGREDKVIPLKIGRKLDAAIPDSTLIILEKAGHVPQEEVPEETIPPILKFLKDPHSLP
jgi:pimeloyl-ACP methyl ester carboxylesterase